MAFSFFYALVLLRHPGRSPSLHGWIEVVLEEVFEGYDVYRSLIVGADGFYTSGNDDVNPRLKHGIEITHCNLLVDGVGVGVEDAGGISIWGMAGESRSKSKSNAKSKATAKSTATDRSVCSTLTCTQLGEIAKAEFVAKAVGMGFVVAKPWGDSEPYDFIVNPKKSFIFWRVQVKSAHTIGADGGCSFRAHDHNQRSYTAEDIDALVAYARPMNAWYVMPVRAVEELKSLMLYPESRGKRSRFEKWRESWEVLRKAARRTRQ